MKLDDRGFSDKYKAQVDSTIKLLKNTPETIEDDVSEVILREAALKDSKDHLPMGEDALLTRFVEIYVAGTREVDLGTVLTWDEVKIKKWTVKCRRCQGRCYAIYSHPSLDDIWGDVLDCSQVAAAAATLTAIWNGPELALPVYKVAFYTCLEAKGIGWANQISVTLDVRSECGDWHGCG